MVQPSQRMDAAEAVTDRAAFWDQPGVPSQDSRGTSTTSLRNWQLLVCRSRRLDTAPSAELHSSRVVHLQSSLHQACYQEHGSKKGQKYRGQIPIATMPRDHISTFGPYPLRVTTSGAIQYGVPIVVVRFACARFEIAQKPKSANVRDAERVRDQTRGGTRDTY